MKRHKTMKRQNKNMQLQSGNSAPAKRRRAWRAGRSADACPGLPLDFDDWLQSERERLVEKVLLSWHHPNSQICDRREPGCSTK
jgi:hypothetical protein